MTMTASHYLAVWLRLEVSTRHLQGIMQTHGCLIMQILDGLGQLGKDTQLTQAIHGVTALGAQPKCLSKISILLCCPASKSLRKHCCTSYVCNWQMLCRERICPHLTVE